ncbi:hypothetical protein TEA_028807 [Camellia sinensis var. sinensis]|uniref:Uncharacterized protein n=1 Tax=Camellia sinensis var. sinensis TaxID=542762 RepID=A0A4S4ENV6_CAMSN|nr:hypothetical protein TEA_028807 [Camellia sinensis var. sinensis]
MYILGWMQYIPETSVYPREPEPLKELRNATATHPSAVFGTSPDAGQLIGMLLKTVNPKKTIEVGVFTGYSLLLTALSIPPYSKIVAVDMNGETYEIGLPFIKKAGVEHKIDFIHSQALPFLDKLLEDPTPSTNLGSALDADKGNYINYHERMMKLVKVGGLVLYDNTLWGGRGFVAKPEESVPMGKREVRKATIEFKKLLTTDHRVEISHVPSGDGVLICKRVS